MLIKKISFALKTLDHFHPTDDRTWRQRYWVNSTLYDAAVASDSASSMPVFLMIGGEGRENPVWMGEGAWMDHAREVGGALFFMLEHR